MPGLDGKEILRILHTEFPELKVLMTSGHSGDTTVDELLSAGAAGFLHKPYDPVELRHALDDVLSQ